MDPDLETTAKGIFERAKSIILNPIEEWIKIEAEPRTQQEILMGYVLPLAAIGPIALLIAKLLGLGPMGVVHYPFIGSIIGAVVTFGIMIAGIYALSFLANALAPNFSGSSNQTKAFKLLAYSLTAAWIAALFLLLPQIRIFWALGAYSVYLLYTGSRTLIGVPEEKAIAYTAILAVSAFVVLATAFSVGSSFAPPTYRSIDLGGSSITLPGGGSIDADRIEQMSKQAENSFNGKSPPVDAAKMQALMPAAIGSYQRTAVEAAGASVGGSHAEGTYTSGDNNFKLRITDMSALGALAGIAGAFGVSQSREDADGYERTGTVDGHMQTESWNKTDNRGKFGIVVGDRFMVEAEGKAASIDELKAAVATIDPADLADLAG